MPTLLIEHAISEFATWNEAFTRFAARRAAGGVLHERIMQPIDDPHYVFIELDFATREAAQRFKQFLETTIWANPADSPALVGSPRARIADTVPLDHR
ncbi:MAG: hypothetical protein ABIQ61_06205 [Ornithinibacter sp.]